MSSSCVNCPSLMSSGLLIILMIRSSVILGGFSKQIVEMLFPQVYSFFLAGSVQFYSHSALLSAHLIYCMP